MFYQYVSTYTLWINIHSLESQRFEDFKNALSHCKVHSVNHLRSVVFHCGVYRGFILRKKIYMILVPILNYQKPMKVDIIHSSTPGQRVSLSLGKIMHPCLDLGESHICSNEVLHLQDISNRTYYLLWIRIFVNFTIFFSRIFCPILA